MIFKSSGKRDGWKWSRCRPYIRALSTALLELKCHYMQRVNKTGTATAAAAAADTQLTSKHEGVRIKALKKREALRMIWKEDCSLWYLSAGKDAPTAQQPQSQGMGREGGSFWKPLMLLMLPTNFRIKGLKWFIVWRSLVVFHNDSNQKDTCYKTGDVGWYVLSNVKYVKSKNVKKFYVAKPQDGVSLKIISFKFVFIFSYRIFVWTHWRLFNDIFGIAIDQNRL